MMVAHSLYLLLRRTQNETEVYNVVSRSNYIAHPINCDGCRYYRY